MTRWTTPSPASRWPQALATFAAEKWHWTPDPDTMRLSTDVMTGMASLIRMGTPALLLVDEIHAPLVHPVAVFTPYLSVPGADRAYAVHSASKAFNLPGLKAALIVPGTGTVDELAARLPATLDYSASSIGMLAQAVALNEGREWLRAHLSGLAQNRALLGSLLAEQLPEVRWTPPEATYLAWLDFRSLGLTGDPADVILGRGRVALNSGVAFGAEGLGHVRLNFATSPSTLVEAVERIREQ